MNKEELIGKLQMVYVGDRNALNEMIGYFDGLKEVINILKKENKKYKEVIDKAIKYANENVYKENNGCGYEWWEITDKDELLDILKEVE